MSEGKSHPKIRFGVFEFDPRARELSKHGLRLKLPEQALQVLTALLEEAGRVVLREELQKRLWPDGTHVDYEQSLRKAVNKLREALGDSAGRPVYIETLARRGYRFVAPVVVERPAQAVSLRQEESATTGAEAAPPVVANAEVFTPFRRAPRRSELVFGGVAIAVGVLIGVVLMWQRGPAHEASVIRTVLKLEPGLCLDRLHGPEGWTRPARTAMALASDGSFIVYSAVAEDSAPEARSQLYLRRMGEAAAKAIPGTEGGASPFLSPDDRWVGFWAGRKLMKVPIEGGVPVALCAGVEWLFGATWGSDNRVVFSAGESGGLSVVPADGGRLEVLTVPDKRRVEGSHRLPRFLPSGRGLLFTVMREAWDLHPRVAVLELKTRQWRSVLDDAADARYAPSGHLVFLRQGTLMAVGFDLDRLQVTGQPVPVITDVMQALNSRWSGLTTAAGQFGISNSGELVYGTGGITPDQQDSLVWVDQQGGVQPVFPFKGPFLTPRISPDGSQIVCTLLGRESQVWEYDLARGTSTRLTREGKALDAIWTPDGKRVTFDWREPGILANLFWRAADGNSAMEQLATSEYRHRPGSWSPDGATLAFLESRDDTRLRIGLLDVKSRRITRFLVSPSDQSYPEFSPDGRWLAYVADQGPEAEVYVSPVPGPGARWQISNGGEPCEPLWASSGRQLFYRRGDQVWVVDVGAGLTFSAGKPRLLFTKPGFAHGFPLRTWDQALNGRRFLMVQLDQRRPAGVTELNLVQNWFQELERLAPSGKK